MSTQELQTFVSAIYPLKEDEWAAFEQIWQPFSCKRKTLLTKAGEGERYLYFVLDGVQRGYGITSEGEEATIIFTYPYSFSGVADAFLTQTPSAYFLETLTSSTFLRTTYAQLEELIDQAEQAFAIAFFQSHS